jgi:hypothetical protein
LGSFEFVNHLYAQHIQGFRVYGSILAEGGYSYLGFYVGGVPYVPKILVVSQSNGYVSKEIF